MSKDIYKNFSKKNGTLSNLDEAIEAFDVLAFNADTLLLNGEEIATINNVTFAVDFFSEEANLKFQEEIKDSGLLNHIRSELNIDDVPLNIAAVIAKDKNINSVKEHYENQNNDQNGLLSFVNNLLKSKEEKQSEKLENHRSKLKEKEISKSKKLKR